jgi:hypothetical protein
MNMAMQIVLLILSNILRTKIMKTKLEESSNDYGHGPIIFIYLTFFLCIQPFT